MALIKMTPEELRDASSTLNSKAEELISLVEAIKSTVDTTTSEWAGAAQSSFVASFEEMYPTLHEDFPNVVTGIATQLSGAAEALEEADAQIASAFQG